MNKKGYYFTIDAFLALGIIITILLVMQPINREIKIETELHRDIIKTLSSLEMGEIDIDYELENISFSPSSSVLEQIVELHAKGDPQAEEFTKEILEELDISENIGIWFNEELIASDNKTSLESSEKIWTDRQMISGIDRDNATGYSSRVYLTRTSDVDYSYFGGYIGDGNVSIKIENKGEINEIMLEIATNTNFDVYINEEFSGHYEMSPTKTTPAQYDISSYIEHFENGTNIMGLKSKDSLHISGGHLKLNYNESYEYERANRHYFPGVEGLINIYDSFYSPGNLTGININLNIDTDNQTAFITVGGEKIKNFTTTDMENIKIDNETMTESFSDFKKLSEKTIPIRIGLENVTYNIEESLDLVSIFESTVETEPYISELRSGHYTLINETSNIPNSRMGMIGYIASLPSSLRDPLTKDFEYLRGRVNDWEEDDFRSQNRDLCIAIDKAIEYFEDEENPPLVENPQRISTVMAVGELTHCDGGKSEDEANQEVVYKACEIGHEEHDITFYTVGFGDNEKTLDTLQEIAECSGGGYYEGELEGIEDIYEETIRDIILEFQLQTIVEGNMGELNTKISPESYIEYNYSHDPLPHGLLVTAESETFNSSSETTFKVPKNSTPVEARAISYSGDMWTQSLSIYDYKEEVWENVFNLSQYGEDYTELGDPYRIDIPKQKIREGDNRVRLFRGTSPLNYTLGSESNKVIYTILKEGLGYSPISPSAQGCEWTIEFYDGTNITASVPENYTGEKCYYTSEENEGIIYNNNDAIDLATYDLLSSFDFNSDGKINSKFSERDFKMETSQISDIPYAYQSIVEVRSWR